VNILSQPITLLLGSALLLSGCFSAEDIKQHTPNEQRNVLVQVNNEVITDEDLQFFIDKAFTNNVAAIQNTEINQKILASLVASKAMKITMQAELSQEQLNNIEMKTKHYQEELFIKEYLQQYAIPEPVSFTMVKNYYHKNLEQFGKTNVKVIEILQRKTKLNEGERDAILANVSTINDVANWQSYAENKGKSLGLSYVKTKFTPNLFDQNVTKVINDMQVGEKAKITFVQGRPYIVRVVDVQTLPAKPLSAVSADIRKKLAALQLKKAVKESSEKVIEKVNVVYTELNN